jgi:hypothetical protein
MGLSERSCKGRSVNCCRIYPRVDITVCDYQGFREFHCDI